MKFPKFHYELILEIIKSNGLDVGEFNMVKRKGWIHIEHKPTLKYFSYFKKKETHLNPGTGQWEFGVLFKVKMDGPQINIEPTFDSMMELFSGWTSKIITK